jgi:uncharacterized protein (DUF1697 family)
MPKFVALLRGINVGGHRVSMENLRTLFAELGFSHVETFIASGNVIFETEESNVDALEVRIEAHLKAALGYEVATFLRTPAALTAIAESCPFTPAETDSLYVMFFKVPLTENHRASLDALPKDTDALTDIERELFRLIRGKITESAIPDALFNRALKGTIGTTRNINTIQKIAKKHNKV